MQWRGTAGEYVGVVGQQVQQSGVRDVTPAIGLREVRWNMLFTRRKIAGSRRGQFVHAVQLLATVDLFGGAGILACREVVAVGLDEHLGQGGSAAWAGMAALRAAARVVGLMRRSNGAVAGWRDSWKIS